MSSSEVLFQRRWKNLLSWLHDHGLDTQHLLVECKQADPAGHGLFARNACPPATLLFAIPANAMINIMTLAPHYPPAATEMLTATQFISMHLFLWRPRVDEDSTDPHFGPYISTLPRCFDSHPLAWLLQSTDVSRLHAAGHCTSLLRQLPPSVVARLQQLFTRFSEDWIQVKTFLSSMDMAWTGERPLGDLETFDALTDFLWAWLNVNTRCVYYRLKPLQSDPDNLTMCPILDFANHTLNGPHLTPIPRTADIPSAAPVRTTGEGFKIYSPANTAIREGDEIYLRYGFHSNRTLFVEYGFVMAIPEGSLQINGEVDVYDLVEEIIYTSQQLGKYTKDMLVTENYWGNWTLHSTAEDAEPSWRLITALRLHHLVTAPGRTNDSTLWYELVHGKREIISEDNERAWKDTILRICEALNVRARPYLDRVTTDNVHENWITRAHESIRNLWKEEELPCLHLLHRSILSRRWLEDTDT